MFGENTSNIQKKKLSMPISKPYHRLWRPVKGYEFAGGWFYGEPQPTLDFLHDERFICQSEIESLVTTAHLIIRDLYEIFDYVEPHDANLNVFSHRIYELILRTATEFESNCKGILSDNGYSKAPNDMNITDYFKIAAAAKLSEYRVSFNRWSTQHEFRPFAVWGTATYSPLPWYQSYNSVKHNRYTNFQLANFDCLMNLVSGLLCILHAQYGENMDRACFDGNGVSQVLQEEVTTNTFTITAPHFADDDKYDFIWDSIKGDTNPIQNYLF